MYVCVFCFYRSLHCCLTVDNNHPHLSRESPRTSDCVNAVCVDVSQGFVWDSVVMQLCNKDSSRWTFQTQLHQKDTEQKAVDCGIRCQVDQN